MTWQPILDDEARAVLGEIAAAVARSSDVLAEDAALFWAYVPAELHDEACFDRATDALLARIAAGATGLQLFGGLAGAGWVLAHITSGNAEDALEAVDHALLDALAVEPWPAERDLVAGLAGIATYFLERTGPVARAGLARVVGHLDRLAEQTDEGIAWHTPPALLGTRRRERWPDGVYDCGVAHGIPGIAAVLSKIADPRARELCRESLRWLRGRRQSPDPRGRFPSWIAVGREPDRARSGWCYGDPGIAIALWNAAVRVGEDVGEWQALAVEAMAPFDVPAVGLCHGVFGLAHLCNRAYQASRDPVLCEASRWWFARGLAMRRPGEGVAGFPIASSALLDGALGIGLALSAALGSEEPAWDRRLACDVQRS